MRPWLYLAGALALIGALVGAYAYGRSDGGAIERDKQAAIDKAVEAERKGREQKVEGVAAAAVQQEQARRVEMREVRHEVERVVERPVYRNVCVDNDGVQALDRAAAAANGEDPGIAAAGAGEGTKGAPER